MIKDIIHKTMMITYMELQILWLGRIMVSPKETVYNSWSLWICGHDKGGFVDEFPLKILRWGDYPELSTWTQCYHEGPHKWNKKGVVSEDELWWWKLGLQWWNFSLGRWKRATNQGIRVASGSKEGKEADSPLEPAERTQPCGHLGFSN